MTTDLSPDLATDAFPASFLWGAATAAYQIEGAVREGGRGPSIWDTFAHAPGRVLHGDTGDIACDHYHRWREDVELMAWLGLSAYRMSVSWSRLQPTGHGPLNPVAVAFYRELLTAVRERGIRPFVTLYHWDLPQPLEDAGGWPVRATAEAFVEYAALTVAALGDLVEDWVTLNEPWCSAFLGYGYGAHAPGRTDLPAAVRAIHHLNLAHRRAVPAIRRVQPTASVGVTHILSDVVPATDSPQDVAAARRVDINNNLLVLDGALRGDYGPEVRAIYEPHGLAEVYRPGDLDPVGVDDFLGVNHYQRVVVSHRDGAGHLDAVQVPATPATTSLQWSVIPDSLRVVLLRAHAESGGLPLVITENGASFEDYVSPEGMVDDTERVDYLHGYLGAVGDALTQGVDVRGYFAWSLLDNFEWAEGYRKRFGLVFVDFGTQTRTPKLSATWYRAQIARHARVTGQASPGTTGTPTEIQEKTR